MVLVLLVTSIPSALARDIHNQTFAETHFTCRLSSPVLITWFPKEVICPVCQTKNIFMQWGSYGSYIYHYPSKYQLVFWPFTDSPGWYSCKKCRFTSFMDDFENVPREKLNDVQNVLKEISLPPQKERSDKESLERPPYLEIPTAARIVAAEKIYRVLGEKNENFWSHLYRIEAYHFAVEKNERKANEARRKALGYTETLLKDKNNQGRRKELLYIAGAMRHFLSDDKGALKDFSEALKLTYVDPKVEAEQSKGYDEYLSSLLKEYVEMLQKGKGPRFEKDEPHDH